MTDVLKAVALGIIEGLSEFLPISSTGHMILAMPLLGIDGATPPWRSFLYFIQIGAILAVIVYFRRSLRRRLFRVPEGGVGRHLLVKLAIATVPAAAIGLPIADWVERHLERPVPVAGALVIGAGLMEWIERRCRRTAEMDVDAITPRQAWWIGVAQVVSIIPGTSRAMATIMGGMLVGLPTAVATEFSFYLAIPTLLGAGLMKVYRHRAELDGDHAVILVTGLVVAFGVALVVVDAFMRFVRTRRLRAFAVYRVLLGAAVLSWWLATGDGN